MVKNTKKRRYSLREYQLVTRKMLIGGIIGSFIIPIIWICYLYTINYFQNNNDPTVFDYWSNYELIFMIFLAGGCVGFVFGSILSLFSKR